MTIWDWDPRARRVTWLGALERDLGLAPNGFGGTYEAFLALVHPDDRARVARTVQDALAIGSSFTLEFRFQRADGSVRWSSARGRVWRDAHGRPTRVIGVDVDLSQQKQYEEQLQRAEARYRQLVELSPDGIAVHRDLRIEFINPAGVALLGARDASQVIGRSILDFSHPDDHADVVARVGALHERRQAVPFVALRFMRLDGSMVDVEVAATPVADGDRAIQVVARDLTDRKRADASLRASQERYRTLFESAHDIIYFHDLAGLTPPSPGKPLRLAPRVPSATSYPDGAPLDVTAEPPEHFRESLLSLGFDPNEGDLPLDEEKPREPMKSVEKRAAQAHAKDMRKARRGERRGRGGDEKPPPRGKSATARGKSATGKAAPRKGPAKSSPGKTGAPRPGPTRRK